MAKLGRPRKADEEKVKNHLIAVDYSDYKKLKKFAETNNMTMKQILHQTASSLN